MIDTVEILTPNTPPQLSNYDILYGTPLSPIQKLATMSDKEFEEIILEWVHGYLKSQYVSVRKCGGAGDKGRAWENPQHYATGVDDLVNIFSGWRLGYYRLRGENFIPGLGIISRENDRDETG